METKTLADIPAPIFDKGEYGYFDFDDPECFDFEFDGTPPRHVGIEVGESSFDLEYYGELISKHIVYRDGSALIRHLEQDSEEYYAPSSWEFSVKVCDGERLRGAKIVPKPRASVWSSEKLNYSVTLPPK